ncbi:MAG TPA: hypothetical protein VFU35_02800 [Jatrophihabitans sp.]|nr:hypothetical protein [Jatrophihabitans sp.]
MSDRTYRVIVHREEDDWVASVEGLPAAHTDARNLVTLDTYVREVIVLADGLPDDAAVDLHLAWEYHTGDDVLDRELAALRSDRQQLDQLRSAVEGRTARFAQRLTHDFSVRDVSALLGVSRARAQQLVSSR